MDQNQNQQRRRGHFNRGRRGPARRGPDRHGPQSQAQERQGRDQVDVEQIMQDIRSRIAQRQGIELSNQQIQDLAARRLESILDPRAIKPSLLDGLRRSAGGSSASPRDKIPNEPAYTFEDTTIYDSHRGSLRFMRRLLNPVLKLFFNPNPLIRALHLQARLNVEAAERESERDRRQTEWNALHYEIVQRLVTEVSRVSLEVQALSMRIESLDAKVDFNERRVRDIEGTVHRSRPAGRPTESVAATGAAEPDAAPGDAVVEAQPVDPARRRRRRRRGRRGGLAPAEGGPATPPAPAPALLVSVPQHEPALSGPPEPASEPVGGEPVRLDTGAAPVAAGTSVFAQEERPQFSPAPTPPPAQSESAVPREPPVDRSAPDHTEQ